MASLRRLEIFVAVVRHRGVAEAGRHLLVASSAVSMELRRLEQETGVPLFDPHAPKWTLTPQGAALYRHAVEVLSAMERVEHTVAGFKSGLSGELVVGASTSVGESLLIRPLALFQHRHPEVQIRVLVGNSGQVAHWLQEGRIEMAVMGEPARDPLVRCQPFHRDEVRIIAGPTHPLAVLDSVDPIMLENYPWIGREAGSATRARAEACLSVLGVEVGYRLELGSNEAVKQAVKAGLGIAALSEHVLGPELERQDLRALSVAGWDCGRWFCLAARRDGALGPLASGLWDLITGSAYRS